MWSILSLSLLPGPPEMLAPDWAPSKGQIEQTVCKQMTDVKLWLLYSNTWNHSTVYKKEPRLVKECYLQNVFTNHIHLFNKYIYKQDLALNNQQWLICHQSKPNQTKPLNHEDSSLCMFWTNVNDTSLLAITSQSDILLDIRYGAASLQNPAIFVLLL